MAGVQSDGAAVFRGAWNACAELELSGSRSYSGFQAAVVFAAGRTGGGTGSLPT